MELIDDRKRRILQAIIDDYIDTAEPVGSRTIVKKYQLGFSPATIRNEMADLEDMGYLSQPHTSAGRVPSLSGYRLYVDELMTQYRMTVEEIQAMRHAMEEKIDYLDKIVLRASQLMSELTNYTAVVMGPKIKTGSVKNLRLVSIDAHRALAIIVTNEGIVKDKKIHFDPAVEEEDLEKLERAISRYLVDLDFSEITEEKVYYIIKEAKVQPELIIPVFQFIEECISSSLAQDVHVEGTTNIFNFPEYADIERAKRFLNFVGNRQDVVQLISRTNPGDKGITITIGSENANSQMADCSVITSQYKVGDNMEGYISLIGPVRMDYKKAVSVMQSVTDIINHKMMELTGQEEIGNHGERKENEKKQE